MTDREYAKQKARFIRTAKRWKQRIVPHWTLTYAFHRDGIPGETPDAGGWVGTMKCHAQWAYRKAKIDVDLENIADLDDGDLETMFVHETMHCILHEMRQIVPDKCANCASDRTLADNWLPHEESVAQQLAITIVNAYR